MNKSYASWVPQMAPLTADLIILWLCQLDPEKLDFSNRRPCLISTEPKRRFYNVLPIMPSRKPGSSQISVYRKPTYRKLPAFSYLMAIAPFPAVKEAVTSEKSTT